jgi:hypothetical protein
MRAVLLLAAFLLVLVTHLVAASEDYIPNDMVSWKDDPFLKDYNLEKYNSYEEFVNSQLLEKNNFVVNGGTADNYDTSLYMIGNVSVSVILPESIGGSENWTPEEIAQVHAEVEKGINWWAAQQPNAHLNFIYNYEDSVLIVDEPITQNGFGLWLLNTMSALGYGYENYGGTKYWREGVYDYVNNQKQIKNADWGFVVFVVDSSNDIDGQFANFMFAYTYLSGPFLVMTYNNSWYGINNMDSICAHETGHVFGAVDQYASSGCICNDSVGYLYYENQNCENSCLINEPSIMKNNYPYVFANNLIDNYARGQLGWSDNNSNGILDIIDFEPKVNKSFNGIVGSNYIVNGSANTSGMNAVNPYYHDLIINKIKNVEYSVNNGVWNNGVAVDGNFNSLVEKYSLSYGIFDWGSYLFKIRAKDRFGGVTSVGNYLNINYENMGCSDTDEEDNAYISGFVENYNGVFGQAADECLGKYVLRQYSCSGNNIVYADYSCVHGCGGGVCLKKYSSMLRPTEAVSRIL